MNRKLKNFILKEIKSILNESMAEPSEQLLKQVYRELKTKTGIVAVPTVEKQTNQYISYVTDLSKDLRAPVIRAAFATMTLNCVCREIPQTIGGYSFSFSINWTHPNRGSNGLDIGTVFYKDGKLTSRF